MNRLERSRDGVLKRHVHDADRDGASFAEERKHTAQIIVSQEIPVYSSIFPVSKLQYLLIMTSTKEVAVIAYPSVPSLPRFMDTSTQLDLIEFAHRPENNTPLNLLT